MTIPRSWQESWSTTYQALAAVAVPMRAEQMATMLSLIPFGREDEFRVVELGCGEGYLSAAILEAFPNSRLTALDGSAHMRETAADRLSRFGYRAAIAPFDLFDEDWLPLIDGAGAVVSSLAIHHLDGTGKRKLFGEIAARLDAAGALLIADLVEPGHPVVNQYFGDAYERAAANQSLELTGSDDLFQLFTKEEWNHFHYPDPEVDKPSRLADQLAWLGEAGFAVADCFWMNAGHAIYGGYRSETSNSNEPIELAQSIEIANQVLAEGYGLTNND